MEKVNLFGFDFIASEDYNPVLEYLGKRPVEANKLPMMITPNVDQVVKYSRPENSELKGILKKAALILPDGQPIVWTSRLKPKHGVLPSRLTGSDFFPKILHQVRENKEPHFFIVPDQEIGKKLCEAYDFAGYYAPPFFDVNNKAAYASVLRTCFSEMQSFSPVHVFIGLGFPKQEKLALSLHDLMPNSEAFYYLLGASFEFHLGHKTRAPKWMQKMGLEFLHRILSEPGRMIKRYLVDDLAFIPLLFQELRRP